MRALDADGNVVLVVEVKTGTREHDLQTVAYTNKFPDCRSFLYVCVDPRHNSVPASSKFTVVDRELLCTAMQFALEDQPRNAALCACVGSWLARSTVEASRARVEAYRGHALVRAFAERSKLWGRSGEVKG